MHFLRSLFHNRSLSLIFIVAALITPPDVISQTLLAVPMWLLFETGIHAARLIERRRTEEASATEEGD